jgi:hypothetical protein
VLRRGSREDSQRAPSELDERPRLSSPQARPNKTRRRFELWGETLERFTMPTEPNESTCEPNPMIVLLGLCLRESFEDRERTVSIADVDEDQRLAPQGLEVSRFLRENVFKELQRLEWVEVTSQVRRELKDSVNSIACDSHSLASNWDRVAERSSLFFCVNA